MHLESQSIRSAQTNPSQMCPWYQRQFPIFCHRFHPFSFQGIFIHHDEGSLVGLYDYKFPLDVITLGVLENGGERRIYLEKEIHHVMEATTNCSYEETTDTFLGCSKNHLLSRYMENERGKG